MKNSKSSKGVFAHITIGIQLAATILLFVYAGYRLDIYYDKSPLFLTVGMVLGLVIGFYSLLKEVLGGKADNEKEGNNDKNIKWR